MWAGVSGQWVMAGVSTTTAAALVQLQAPSDLSNLTADPPEDLTILRVMGDFAVEVSTTGSWTLALLVQDTTWTPGSTFLVDSDKRVLWMQSYVVNPAATYRWATGRLEVNNAVVAGQSREMTRVDIAPKVRIEAGKALYLVAYEGTNGSTFTTSSDNMRILAQRTQRTR